MLSFFKHSPYAPKHTNKKIDCLRGFGTAGEMISLSFSLASREPISDLELTGSDLESTNFLMPKDCVSLFIVKVWEQAGIGVYQSAPVRVAELLLKDDRAPLHDGYTRRGRCGHWKHLLRASQLYQPPDVRLKGDVCTSLDCNETKQAWVSIKIPTDAAPGLYKGFVEAKDKAKERVIKRLEFQLEVLPVKLLQPEQDLFIWYKGTLDCGWPQHHVQEEIFRAQLADIYDHGFRSLSLNEHEPEYLQRALNIAHSIGFKHNVLLTAPYPERFSKIDFHQLTPIYYVSDEIDARGESWIRDHVKKWHEVKRAGGQTMSSLMSQTFAGRFFDEEDIGCAPDVLSYYLPANLSYFPAHSEFQELRKRKTYYYWQSYMEKPIVHRVLAGLYLWKSKADGIAPYCYQHLPKPPFSPFDDLDEWEPDFHAGAAGRPFKDHMTTYPARSGSIQTLQWKGMADGIYDLRYLITFESELKRVEQECSEAVKLFVNEARAKSESFLKRISLKQIRVTSETDSAPYAEIEPDEYMSFREQLARGIVTLTGLTKTHLE